MKKLVYALALTAVLAPACTDPTDDGPDDNIEDTDTKADGSTTPQISDDQLNGMWHETLGGHKQPGDVVIDSWSAIGIRIHLGDKVVQLTRTGNDLAGDGIALTANPHKSGIKDDELSGTIAGQTVSLRRDSDVKDPLTVTSIALGAPHASTTS